MLTHFRFPIEFGKMMPNKTKGSKSLTSVYQYGGIYEIGLFCFDFDATGLKTFKIVRRIVQEVSSKLRKTWSLAVRAFTCNA